MRFIVRDEGGVTMTEFMKDTVLFLMLAAVAACLLFVITRCGAPPIEEILGPGVDCKARITMPDLRPGETVDVAVKIYDCKGVTP